MRQAASGARLGGWGGGRQRRGAGTCGRGALEAWQVEAGGRAARAGPRRLGLAEGRRRQALGGARAGGGTQPGPGLNHKAGVHTLGSSSSWAGSQAAVLCRVGRVGRARLQEGGAYRQCTGA